MTTPLPYRLLASAQALRGLASRSSMPAAPGLRIARELEEAAQALEAGPWIRTSDRRPPAGALIVKRWCRNGAVWAGIYSGTDKDSSFDEWIALPAHPSAQVAQEGAAGVLAADNWQQYAKDGETAQACIERHRREQDTLLKLLAQSREPLTSEQIIALLPAGWTGMLAQVMEFARRIEAARGVATDGALSPHAAALDVETVLERLDFIAGHEASAILRDTAEAAAAMIRAAHGVEGSSDGR